MRGDGQVCEKHTKKMVEIGVLKIELLAGFFGSCYMHISTIGSGLSSLLMGSRIIPKASSVVAPSKKIPFSPNMTGAAGIFPPYSK